MRVIEGTDNVTNVSREEFSTGPRRPRVEKSLSRRAIAPVFYMPGSVETLAKVTPLPNALLEQPEPIDAVVELLVETNLIAGIAGELRLQELMSEAKDIIDASDTLRALHYAEEDIQEFIVDYLETIDESLSEKARLAININIARRDTVDIEAFASLRDHA